MFSQSLDDIISYGCPHVIILLLDLAPRRGMLILNLNCPEDILPYILGVGSVPEGEDCIFLIDRQDRFDLDILLFNHKGMDGLVALIASHTGPDVGVFITPNLKRVDQRQLLLIGNTGRQIG
jgi:hypothetical protein